MANEQMKNKIDVDEYLLLKQRDTALPARKIELGGDYYYRCYWISCDNVVDRYCNFCSACAQRLSFDDE